MAHGLRSPPPHFLFPRGVLIDAIYRYHIDTVFDKTVSICLSSIDTIIDTAIDIRGCALHQSRTTLPTVAITKTPLYFSFRVLITSMSMEVLASCKKSTSR